MLVRLGVTERTISIGWFDHPLRPSKAGSLDWTQKFRDRTAGEEAGISKETAEMLKLVRPVWNGDFFAL